MKKLTFFTAVSACRINSSKPAKGIIEPVSDHEYSKSGPKK